MQQMMEIIKHVCSPIIMAMRDKMMQDTCLKYLANFNACSIHAKFYTQYYKMMRSTKIELNSSIY